MNISDVCALIKEKCTTSAGNININILKDRWWEDRNLMSLRSAILQLTEFASDCSIIERSSMILHGILCRPECLVCSKSTNWQQTPKKFSTYCSARCASIGTVEKRKETNLERYGVDNFSKTTDFLEKSKQTFTRNYGVDNPSKSAIVVNKIKDSFSKYEGGHPLRDPLIKAKVAESSIEKYGCHHTQRHVELDKLKLLDNYDWLQEYLKTYTVQQLADFVGMSHSAVGAKLKAHNLYSEVSSGFQNNVILFLKQFIDNSEMHINTRNLIHPLEIDIFIPSKNVAIECNGTYWHSELNGRGKEYHLNKSQLLKDKGIHLIHIWEHEWNSKLLLVQSRIKAKLGISNQVYARKCTIADVSHEDATKFLNDNHIQGACNASVRLGLIYENTLVALMTFGKSRYDKLIDWELIRYCNLMNTSVTGGASKLLSCFIANYKPNSIVSYSAKEWNSGNLYSKLGFSYVSASPPAYYYTNDYINFCNRVTFQKHKLKGILETYDPTKTEWENMKANKYDRIWDCGTDKWIIKF